MDERVKKFKSIFYGLDRAYGQYKSNVESKDGKAGGTAYIIKKPVVDTTGAGDAFNGALAVGLANDLEIKEALIFANKVAGISTTKLGAAASMPFSEEIVDN